jgi:hypothetical protein
MRCRLGKQPVAENQNIGYNRFMSRTERDLPFFECKADAPVLQERSRKRSCVGDSIRSRKGRNSNSAGRRLNPLKDQYVLTNRHLDFLPPGLDFLPPRLGNPSIWLGFPSGWLGNPSARPGEPARFGIAFGPGRRARALGAANGPNATE